jgi:hypothetical protein
MAEGDLRPRLSDFKSSLKALLQIKDCFNSSSYVELLAR